MDVIEVGELTEYPNGTIDASHWTIRFKPPEYFEDKVCKQELIRLAKQAGTYTYKDN